MLRFLVFRHGIVINRLFMEPMARHFRRLGYHVENCTYPTTRKFIEEHARDLSEEAMTLAERLTAAGDPHEFYVITHSLGGLVLRYALSHFPMPAIKRAVQIAPPNQGSVTARHFRNFAPFRWLYGNKSGAQLASEPPGIFGDCGVPEDLELGIIAGDVRTRVWPTVPLERPHDGIVAVREARLGDFPLITVPHHHTPILFSKRVWNEAAHFLEHGEFSAPGSPR